MELLTDVRAIAKKAGENWDENSKFRRWLKGKEPREVEETVDRIGKEIAAGIDCTQCANCCRALTIVPKSADIHRLAIDFGLEVHEFKEKYLKKDFEGDLVFRQKPCPFLKGNLCGVYEARPETCRSYPHLDKSHMSGRGWYILENTYVCPIVFNVYEELKRHYSFSLCLDGPL